MLTKLGTINIYNIEGAFRVIIDLNHNAMQPTSACDQLEGNGLKLSEALQDLVIQLEDIEQ